MYVAEEMLLKSKTVPWDLFPIVFIFIKLQAFSMNFPTVQLSKGVMLWLVQLKDSKLFSNDQIQTWKKQGFAECLNTEYEKLWLWC